MARGVLPGTEAVAAPVSKVERHYEAIRTPEQLAAWLTRIHDADVVSVDTETTSLDPLRARIVGISIAIAPGQAAYLPLAHRGTAAADQLPFDETLAQLKPWLESPTHKKLGQNLKYDQHVFANHGITLRGVADDTLLMSYVLASHERHNLDDQAERELGETTIKYEDLCGKGAKQIGFDEVAIEQATDYAAEDADIALRLAAALQERLAQEPRLEALYRDIELPVRDVLFQMERTGVLLDAQLLSKQSHELGLRLISLEQQAYELAGMPFNLGSPKQIGEIFFEKLGLPVTKKNAERRAVHR